MFLLINMNTQGGNEGKHLNHDILIMFLALLAGNLLIMKCILSTI